MRDESDPHERTRAAGLLAAAVMEAMSDPEVLAAHDAACNALEMFGGLLIERNVPPGQVLTQLQGCAAAVFCRGLGLE
jgi:hypothetical protein